MKKESDPLKTMMDDWTDMPQPLGSQLAAPVWNEIRRAESRSSWLNSLMASLWEIDGLLARPRVFATVLAVGIFVGVAVAEVSLHLDALRTDGEMTARYLSLLEAGNR
jgi:hypothetical protein